MEDWVIGVSDVSLISGSGGSVGDIYEYDYTYGDRTCRCGSKSPH